jgi:hypothetical protein
VKVLVYKNRKTDGLLLFDVSTDEQMQDALRALFAHFDMDWGFYDSLREPLPLPESAAYEGFCQKSEVEINVKLSKPGKLPLTYESPCLLACGKTHTMYLKLEHYQQEERRDYEYQKPLYDAARKGDMASLQTLFQDRAGHEYEGYEVVETTDPIKFLGEIVKRGKR